MTESEVQSKPIDWLLAQADESLARGELFTCQRHAIDAVRQSHLHQDYVSLGRAVVLVRAVRSEKFRLANAVRKIVRISSYEELDPYLTGEMPIQPGWYLFEPMLVAADGRDFRERADAEEVAALVIVREPETQLGLWPVAMVGPRTVRVMLQPPKRMSAAWMKEASAAMGAEAIARVDPDASPINRLDRLVALLETVTEDDALHAEVERTCRCAVDVVLAASRNGASDSGATPPGSA